MEAVRARGGRGGGRRRRRGCRRDGTPTCAHTHAPKPPHCRYGLRAPASCVRYLPEAQGSLPRGAGGRDVHRTHTCAPYAYQPRGSGVPYATPPWQPRSPRACPRGRPPRQPRATTMTTWTAAATTTRTTTYRPTRAVAGRALAMSFLFTHTPRPTEAGTHTSIQKPRCEKVRVHRREDTHTVLYGTFSAHTVKWGELLWGSQELREGA